MIFVNPLFLFALFALAIPIAVHLFNFRKYKHFYFSNTLFLHELKEQTKRQSQLKKILILSLRLLAVAFIVLAFARPFIPLEDNTKQLKGINYIACYIDNSFSMENVSKRGTLLDEAKDKTKSIVDAYAEDDQFLLITNDFQPKHQQFLTKEEIKKEIQNVQISSSSPQLETVMQYALSFLTQRQTENKLTYLISDFQKSAISFSSLPKDKQITTYLVPLKANTVKNIYIDTAWFDSPVFQKGQEITLTVIVRNDTKENIEKLPIKLYINNNQKAVSSADIQSNGYAEVKMNFTLFEEGIQQAYVDIVDYPISFDDKLYLSFSVSNNYSIMSIYGEKESPYLYALFGADSNINYQPVQDRSIDYAILKQQDLIVLDQVKEQSSGFIQAIDEYIRQGGSVLIIPSTNRETALNSELCSYLQITNYETVDTQRTRLSTLNHEHVIYKNIFERIHENMDMPSVFQSYVLGGGVYSNKQSLIQMENNRDFLCVHALDKGKVFLLAVPLDDAFSMFQKHALFVPTLYNMAVVGNIQEEPYYIIGENNRIALNKIDLEVDKVVEIADTATSFAFIPEIRNQLSGVSLFVHDQLKDAGNYVIKDQEEILGGISFNYNRSESQMQFYDKSSLETEINKHQLHSYKVLNLQNKSNNAIISEIQSVGIHLWQYLIVLALMCLLAEVILLRIWKI